MPTTACISLFEALSRGPAPAGNLAVPVFSHGTLVAEMYQPSGVDRQKPHDRDEAYIVARGRAVFFDGNAHRAVEAGAFIFVGAGQPHRFEEISGDFAAWVFFYGPEGGEAPAPDRR